jgi:hypothetical protein
MKKLKIYIVKFNDMSSLLGVILLNDEKWGTRIKPQTIIISLYHLYHIFAQYFIDTQDLSSYTSIDYASKDGKPSKAFPAMSLHMPNRGKQLVRYYGYCSNVSRGKRQTEGSTAVNDSLMKTT